MISLQEHSLQKAFLNRKFSEHLAEAVVVSAAHPDLGHPGDAHLGRLQGRREVRRAHTEHDCKEGVKFGTAVGGASGGTARAAGRPLCSTRSRCLPLGASSRWCASRATSVKVERRSGLVDRRLSTLPLAEPQTSGVKEVAYEASGRQLMVADVQVERARCRRC